MNNLALMSNGKRRLRKVLYVYIAVIMVLIFCSKTIYNYSLPRVAVVMPETGRLNKELEARGVIEFAETIDLCADNSGRIDRLLVREGDVVTAGTVIAQLAAPEPDAAAIRESALDRDRIDNRMAGLRLSRSGLQDKLARLQADPTELHPYENAIADAQTELNRAQSEYDQALSIVRDGHSEAAEFVQAVADAEREWSKKKAELQKAEEELAQMENDDEESGDSETPEDSPTPGDSDSPEDSNSSENSASPEDAEHLDGGEDIGNKAEERAAAEQKRVLAQAAAEDAEYAYNRAVSELGRASENATADELERLETAGFRLTDAQTILDRAKKNLEVAVASQRKTIEAEKTDINLQLEMLELEIELAEIDLRAIGPPEGTSEQITTAYDGRIIAVDKRMGQYASVGERIAVAGVDNGTFICEVIVPEERAGFIEIGDRAAVRQSGADKPLDGTVVDIALEGDVLRLKLMLVSEELSGGEYVQIKFTKQSMEYEVVIPAEAVISDPISSYVWVLESRHGALGIEYYTRKVNVLIADKDGFYTAISAGIDAYQPVVVSYDKVPVVNGRVSRME